MSARRDREVLVEALATERRLEAIYGALAARGGSGLPTASLFADHCREHARGLTTALENRGGAPGGNAGPLPPGDAADALRAEEAAVGVYHRAHAGFEGDTLLPTLTSIMANHGQHLAVLRQGLGQEPPTLAFEVGAGE